MKETLMGGEDIRNKAEEWKGAAKETFGDVTDNEDLQAEGAAEKAKAKAKQTLEDVKDNVAGAAEAVKDSVHEKFDN
jgi:uncharacterized protein YjbJ (UPF0337 family)